MTTRQDTGRHRALRSLWADGCMRGPDACPGQGPVGGELDGLGQWVRLRV
jgi:hypothetical protein